MTPYQALANFPSGEDILADEEEHDEIAAVWGAYNSLFADLKTAIENPGDYAVPLVQCSGGECTRTMANMATEPLAMAQAERIQDMVLDAQFQIEQAAEDCLEDEENCTFNIATIRSPYAVRASMPVLLPGKFRSPVMSDAPAADTMPTLDDHMAVHLREFSQGRCVYGATTPGCIRNVEIRRWAERTGLVSMIVPDTAALRAKVTACNIPEEFVLTGEGNLDAAEAPTIWLPASVTFKDGEPDCTSS